MDSDDAPTGRVLSRRDAVALLGTLSLSVVGGHLSYARAALAAGGSPPAGYTSTFAIGLQID